MQDLKTTLAEAHNRYAVNPYLKILHEQEAQMLGEILDQVRGVDSPNSDDEIAEYEQKTGNLVTAWVRERVEAYVDYQMIAGV